MPPPVVYLDAALSNDMRYGKDMALQVCRAAATWPRSLAWYGLADATVCAVKARTAGTTSNVKALKVTFGILISAFRNNFVSAQKW
jgi:hypothetical protein